MRLGNLRQLRQSEIENLHQPRARDHDVRWLHIAMGNACVMCFSKRIRNCYSPLEALAKLERTLLQYSLEGLSIHVLHCDAGSLADVEDLVNSDDARMVQR